jgi:hypothetical protein
MPVVEISGNNVNQNAGSLIRAPAAPYTGADPSCNLGFTTAGGQKFHDCWFTFKVDDIKRIDTINDAFIKLRLWARTDTPVATFISIVCSEKIDVPPSSAFDLNVLDDYYTNLTGSFVEQFIDTGVVLNRLSTFYTVNLKTIIEEVLDDTLWLPGSYLTFFIKITELYFGVMTFVGNHPNQQDAFFWDDPDVPEDHQDDQHPILVIDFTPETGGDVTHDLDIQQIISYQAGPEIVEHRINLIQEIDWWREINRAVEHSFVFDPFNFLKQDISYFDDGEILVLQDLIISDFITVHNVYNRSLEHELIIEDENLRNLPLDKNLRDYVEWVEDIDYTKAYNRSHESSFTTTHTITTNRVEKKVQQDLLSQQTVTSDTSLLQNAKPNEATLTVTQTISWSMNTTKNIEHSLNLVQAIAGVLNSPTICNPVLTWKDAPMLSETGTLILQYPVVTPTSTITLPSPLLNNRQEISATRIHRETLGGDLVIYADDDWPVTELLRFTFDHVTDTVAANMRTFLSETLGLDIKLTDHEGREWKGIILNPDGQFTDVDGTECNNTAGFDFQGELL